jgi:hypothetical protein
LKAYRPERWGEQSTLTVNTNGDDPASMSNEELEKKLAELETKESNIREPKGIRPVTPLSLKKVAPPHQYKSSANRKKIG